jgi:D-arabinose 1-dehydrogenase-like Zn-dependent alcohol dehydrogenase
MKWVLASGAHQGETTTVDLRESSLSLAKSLGAEITINAATPPSTQDILRLTGGGVHASMILADSQAALDIATGLTKKHGRIYLVAAVDIHTFSHGGFS